MFSFVPSSVSRSPDRARDEDDKDRGEKSDKGEEEPKAEEKDRDDEEKEEVEAAEEAPKDRDVRRSLGVTSMAFSSFDAPAFCSILPTIAIFAAFSLLAGFCLRSRRTTTLPATTSKGTVSLRY